MAFLRQETQFLRDSLTAAATVDITTYDRAGRFGADGEAVICAADETPQFIFMESAAAGEPVSVAFLGMGQVAVLMSGNGSNGDKVSIGANGVFVSSATTQAAEMDEDDLGISKEDWTDGDEIELFIYLGRKV